MDQPPETPRKRRRLEPVIDSGYESVNNNDVSSSEASEVGDVASALAQGRTLSRIVTPGPAFPLSLYQGWKPPLPEVAEGDVIRGLKKAHRSLYGGLEDRPEYTFFQLSEFSIYRFNGPKAGELVTLDQLQNRNLCSEFLLDGVLSYGSQHYFIHAIRFSTLTIDGYGDLDVIDLSNRICVQSDLGEDEDVWYQLRTPSPEYRRFYKPFVWLAQFTKLFVDYLTETESVTLRHFQRSFWDWLHRRHGGNPKFQSWSSEVKSKDFRTTVAANVGFLWKEYCGVTDGDDDEEHPIWGEVDPERLTALPKHAPQHVNTIVTPFAYGCFKHMYFAECMEQHPIQDPDMLDQVSERKASMKLTPLETGTTIEWSGPSQRPTDLQINEGDVISVESNCDSGWKPAFSFWLAYVQAVRQDAAGVETLDVLWLYHPTDTTLGTAYYPFRNEFFLSDNCNCGDEPLTTDAVLSKVDVEWFVTIPSRAIGVFVRQKFQTAPNDDFRTLQHSDFRCNCRRRIPDFQDCQNRFRLHDTVLVLKRNRLEPALLLEFDDNIQKVRLRLFDRKARIDPRAKSNELAMSNAIVVMPACKLIRNFSILLLDPQDIQNGRIPAPYDREGAGDLFYMAHDYKSQFECGTPLPRQGWDLREPSPRPKLRGMGVFCGGGNLDRGLEEGGSVDFAYAIDWLPTALHSYRANAQNPDSVNFWSGSVNDYLANAIDGSADPLIAKPGNFNVLSAGSPCPGFSILQRDRLSHQSLTNASMVASVISFVDFYSPEYCVLENVVNMTAGMGFDRKDMVFAQILAALVALGYQVQQFLMDAWSFGSPQRRSRVFVVASAPGLQPLPQPPHTHDQPPSMRFVERSLGRSNNGMKYCVRREDYTPFSHVSVRDATDDLPNIADSQPQLCPAFPDHRLSVPPGTIGRTRIAVVPVRPPGMGLFKAYREGLTFGEPARYCDGLSTARKADSSNMYSRIEPDGLFPTVLTKMQPHDGRVGRVIHWAEHRSLSVMEFRRAQGFLDHEVLIGNPVEQLVIIGNSVDRKVSLALGMALRESWEHSRYTPRNQDAEEVKSVLTLEATWVRQSRAGTLCLSPVQIEDVRINGFKAIRRILTKSPPSVES